MLQDVNWGRGFKKKMGVGVVLFLSNLALAGGGDHDVPTPFDTIDSRFELADKGYYVLSGKVVFFTSHTDKSESLMPYLHVDLEKYPWLANEARMRFPFYPLEGELSSWKKYSMKTVKLTCKAHGQLVQGKKGMEYSISLEPMLPAILE